MNKSKIDPITLKVTGPAIAGKSYPNRKGASLTEEGLKAWEQLQKHFPGVTDSSIIEVALLRLATSVSKPKVAPKTEKKAPKVKDIAEALVKEAIPVS